MALITCGQTPERVSIGILHGIEHYYLIKSAGEASITELVNDKGKLASGHNQTPPIDTRILIIGPSWVGDMVMAQCLFITLKQLYPACLIDVLAPAWSGPILERMPEVHETLAMPVGHGQLNLSARWKLAKGLKARGYTQAIVLPNSLKSALIPWFAGIPLRTGWRGEMRYGLLNDIRRLDKECYPLMIQRFAALAYKPAVDLPDTLPWPGLVVRSDLVTDRLQAYGLGRERPVLALCPGAEFGPAKRWPENYYAEVAQAMIEGGWQVWLFGSSNDQAVTGQIHSSLSMETQAHCHNLAGKTQLSEAIDLLSCADAVVSNDSGLMHIAAALRRPLVVVYGSTSPGFTPPLSDQVTVLSIPVDCGPCFERECPEGHLKCLKGIAPHTVVDAINTLAGKPLPGALT